MSEKLGELQALSHECDDFELVARLLAELQTLILEMPTSKSSVYTDKLAEASQTIAVLNLIDCKTLAQGTLYANKELDEYKVAFIVTMLDQWGHTTVILQTEQEPATMAIASAVREISEAMNQAPSEEGGSWRKIFRFSGYVLSRKCVILDYFGRF